MSALAVTTTFASIPARAGSPDRRRSREATPVHRGRAVGCRVDRACSEPGVRLTRRGMAVALSSVALVMGSAVATVITAFLSVSNLPL